MFCIPHGNYNIQNTFLLPVFGSAYFPLLDILLCILILTFHFPTSHFWKVPTLPYCAPHIVCLEVEILRQPESVSPDGTSEGFSVSPEPETHFSALAPARWAVE